MKPIEEIQIDLTKLREALSSKHHGELKQAIKSLQDLFSCQIDIKSVGMMLRELISLDGLTQKLTDEAVPQAERLGLVGAALFEKAVITYSRAVHSSTRRPNARANFGPRKLPSELQETHIRIVNLRNDTFAHFGEGEKQLDRPWHTERLVGSPTTEGVWAFTLPYDRFNYRGELLARFVELIEEVSDQLSARIGENWQRLSNALNETLISDRPGEFRKILDDFRFKESDVFTGTYSLSRLDAAGGMWGSDPLSTTTTVRSPLAPLMWLEDETAD